MPESKSDALFEISYQEAVEKYLVRQFSLARFNKGSRFVLDSISESSAGDNLNSGRVICGELRKVSYDDDAMVLDVDGAVKGRVVIQAIRLDGAERLLMYQPGRSGDSSASDRNSGQSTEG